MWIRVYYEDTDCGGIVYHTNYIKYCERARSELFFSNGTLPSRQTCGFVVSALDAKFLGFARLGDILWVSTKLCKLGRVQILLHQQIYVLSTQTPNIHRLQDSYGLSDRENLADVESEDYFNGSLVDKQRVFDAFVRMGYIDIVTKSPAQIPQSFIDLLSMLPKDL